jgi:hypothetical protein
MVGFKRHHHDRAGYFHNLANVRFCHAGPFFKSVQELKVEG